jgi:Trk K+ transport system NAD-binding subunit
MKYMPSQLFFFLQSKTIQRNIQVLLKFLFGIVIAIIVYSVLFHFIMEYEGKQYSWITGLYWTLTVMSTLGFGDITFVSDVGRVFSIVVLLSGIFFLLVMLPFTFIQFFYAPWLEAQTQMRTPRELSGTTSGHIILTNYDPISMNLIDKLRQYNFNYAIVLSDQQKALDLYDLNYRIVIGDLDIPETYQRLRINDAALVFINNGDMMNTNIISTIRELSKTVPIVTNADTNEALDILALAGATHVFQFTKMLGTTLARRALGVSTNANIVGSFGDLLIAEAHATRTPFEGKTLIESKIREKTGINVVGIWQRGKFEIPSPNTLIQSTTVLLLAGSAEQFQQYDNLTESARTFPAPVLILGGGRVGRAAARTLAERGIEYRIVEKLKHITEEDDKYILGNAADIHTLEKAGIQEAPSVFISTHNDDINIYLTIYCRKLRPEIQIISRATLDRNIIKLYMAGADLVMSYASMGANSVLNILKPNEFLMIAEGLNVFQVPISSLLIDKTLAETDIREKTGCNVVGIRSQDIVHINPGPTFKLSTDDELILIGTADGEKLFIKHYNPPIKQ